ncbi:RagB/SusD family nutrient uptake outer membrane protein [Natronoflexus pectinivorans]|uniref:SusD-like starch-binding protein associating with outer membrane n=1 Tax=Natronoflexus pectinivorans TaxID=682526 RepID=A0A4R2GLA4_9BACT|nr:RagB/SusD family nutrient uptake outer membrane protein [Natronoflexus pectinivorans]TCO09693.1 SusD-like starch-binding protein associating with outer membrane [Natronoflexus pectinivorans]
MRHIKFLSIFAIAVMVAFTACINDLDVEPIDPNEATATNVFSDELSYKRALARVYATYAISGQRGGGGGLPDIEGIDEGFGNYLRLYWNLQQLPTDETVMAWDDASIKDFHWHTWSPNDVFIGAMYSRIFYAITLANEFIRTSEEAMGSATGDFLEDLRLYQAESRFLRAFSYWHAIDMFGNVSFVTEEDPIGAFFPQRITRADLFDYIEQELIDLEGELAAPGTNEYARVDRVAAWMLLSKLYLNAQVYIGESKYTEALTYLNKVINEGGYSIDPNYIRMFRVDNDQSPEIIFPISFNAQNTQQYGGMTFITNASRGGNMLPNGVGAWGGIRGIKELVEIFGFNESDFTTEDPVFSAREDQRAQFFFDPESWSWEVENVGLFTHGIGVSKFTNLRSDGEPDPMAEGDFASTDFPMFRLGDAYLMYAEAVLRGGQGGSRATALQLVNELRDRAFGNTNHRITDSELTLDFILDERARELYWEAHRRTDLIRFGKLTGGDYIWTWKGNVPEGRSTGAFRDLYPIPVNDLDTNPNLIQNTGYSN